MRVVLGFILASLVVSALAPSAIEGHLSFGQSWLIPWVLPVVTLFGLVTALPLYSWARQKSHATFLCLLGIGFVSAFGSFLFFSVSSKPTFSQIGTVILVSDGDYTSAGWSSLMTQCVHFGLAGAVGAVVFWLVIRPWSVAAHG
jgi:hypothetical protein